MIFKGPIHKTIGAYAAAVLLCHVLLLMSTTNALVFYFILVI